MITALELVQQVAAAASGDRLVSTALEQPV